MRKKQNNEQADASDMGFQSGATESPTEESSSIKVMTNISSEKLPNIIVYSTDNILFFKAKIKMVKFQGWKKILRLLLKVKYKSNPLNWMNGSLIVITIQILFNSRTSAVDGLEHAVTDVNVIKFESRNEN